MGPSGFTLDENDLRQEIPLMQTALRRAGVAELMRTLAPGPYGLAFPHLQTLAEVERAGALVLEIAKRLAARMPGQVGVARDRAVDFCTLFGLFAAGSLAADRLATLGDAPVQIRAGFPSSRIGGFLGTDPGDPELAWRLAEDLAEFLSRHQDHPDPARRIREPRQLVPCVQAWWMLIARGAREMASDAAFEPYRQAAEGFSLEVSGRVFRGLESTPALPAEDPGDLLPVTPEDIVGNQDYLRAGMRLARDVAGYDFEQGQNPKRFNPVLFALGPPGCGKTVTAHAIGNYFLAFCRERGVPARFLVIRRTDWASSYQNASAQKLIEIFRQDVQAFPGVVGVYWPDIDTAFAARTDPGLRSEERNILGASFGVFDGTLIPRNGKWFLLCDANFLNMDEATLSRISQDPYRVAGPTTSEDFIHLMRDKLLHEWSELLPLSEDEWQEVGRRCVELSLSGRNIEALCRKIATEIEDVDPPEAFYHSDFQSRRRILKELSRPVPAGRMLEIMEAFARFEKEAEAAAQQQRFRERVQEIVFHLSAQKAATGLGEFAASDG
ncbi:MAG: AAA family ATPase [Candidatus Xenobium sp.]|jgi:hypothetical protein|nr:AAA family ATPase [Burkholderiales bacterium]